MSGNLDNELFDHHILQLCKKASRKVRVHSQSSMKHKLI